jgi:two-component system, sensor histidine kinase and response regulator
MPRQRILIVEDDADLRRMLRQALAFDGYDVDEAGDGLHALRLIDAQPPDAIVLDLGLPLVDGYVVMQDVAARAHTRHIPVIVVTGQVSNLDPSDIACLLRKPVTPDDVVNAVRRCIASAGGIQRT